MLFCNDRHFTVKVLPSAGSPVGSGLKPVGSVLDYAAPTLESGVLTVFQFRDLLATSHQLKVICPLKI